MTFGGVFLKETETGHTGGFQCLTSCWTCGLRLAEVEEIHAGADVKRVDTMLDELCVTLILASQEPCEAGEKGRCQRRTHAVICSGNS